MADPSSEGTVLVVAGALVQCFFYGLYTALFLLSASYMFFSRRRGQWLLLTANSIVYVICTAILYYDLVMACVSVQTSNTVRLYRLAQNGDITFLRTRISLFVVTSMLSAFLVIWRFYRLWSKAKYVVALAALANAAVTGWGFLLAHIRVQPGRPTLTYRYTIYRRTSCSFSACLAMLILGRTYWLYRQLRKLYGPHIQMYSLVGALIDAGVLFVVVYCIDLGLTSTDIPFLRPVLPQFAGMTASLILFQEALGRSAKDLNTALRYIQERGDGRSTPILDTLFSTPGVSMQFTVGQGGRGVPSRRSQFDESFNGSNSAFTTRSRSQLADGDDGLGEGRKSKLSVDNAVHEIRQPEKVHE